MQQISQVKNYAFIWHNQAHSMGGVQTLMARMSFGLVQRSRKVEVIFLGLKPVPSILGLFDPRVKITHIDEDQIAALRFTRRGAAEEDWLSADVCIAFNQTAVFYAIKSSRCGGPVVIPYVVGAESYHPTKALFRFREHPGKRLFRRNVDASLICFMTEELRRAHEISTGASMSRAHVIPLPVDSKRFASIDRNPRRFEILSVGRIDPILKPYNFSCISTIKKLREEGYPIVWKIYGGDNTGGYSASFQSKLELLGVTDFVQYKGEIAYDKFPEVLRTAYAFIGMGTSVIEAAAAGVPSLVVIAFESRPITQGSLWQLPAGSVGEVIEGWKLIPVEDCLRSLMRLSEIEYKVLSDREAQCAAENFSMNARLNEFESLAANVVAEFGAKHRNRVGKANAFAYVMDTVDYRQWLVGHKIVYGLKKISAETREIFSKLSGFLRQSVGL